MELYCTIDRLMHDTSLMSDLDEVFVQYSNITAEEYARATNRIVDQTRSYYGIEARTQVHHNKTRQRHYTTFQFKLKKLRFETNHLISINHRCRREVYM